jgi:hypothetical protein
MIGARTESHKLPSFNTVVTGAGSRSFYMSSVGRPGDYLGITSTHLAAHYLCFKLQDQTRNVTKAVDFNIHHSHQMLFCKQPRGQNRMCVAHVLWPSTQTSTRLVDAPLIPWPRKKKVVRSALNSGVVLGGLPSAPKCRGNPY